MRRLGNQIRSFQVRQQQQALKTFALNNAPIQAQQQQSLLWKCTLGQAHFQQVLTFYMELNKMIKIEHNVQTGEVIEMQMTAAEIEQRKAEEAEFIAKKQAEEIKATAKAALLERLGMTAEEAALLLS